MTEIDTYRENACQKLELMISYLGVTAKVTDAEIAGKRMKIKVKSEDAGRIIGRRGRTLSSLQLLLNGAMHDDEGTNPEIVIEIDGYEKHKREKRDTPEKGGDRNRNRPARGKGRDGGGNRERRERPPRSEKREGSDEKKPATEPKPPRERKPRRDKDAFVEDSEFFVDPDSLQGDEVVVEGPQVTEEPVAASAPVEAPKPTPVDNLETCRRKALDAVKEVKRWGDETVLRGMTGEERQAVKDALKDETSIEVVEGEVTGPDMRKVIIREKTTNTARK